MADDDNHDDEKTPTLRRPPSRTVSGVIEATRMRIPGITVDDYDRLDRKINDAHRRIDKMSALVAEQVQKMDQYVTPQVNAAVARSISFSEMMTGYQEKMSVFLSHDIPKMTEAMARFQDRLQLVISNAELTSALSEERQQHLDAQLKAIREDVKKLRSETDNNRADIAHLKRSSVSWWRHAILVASAAAAAGALGVVASWIMNHI